MTKWRTQVVREDAGEDAVLTVPMPVELSYGKCFHCPHCNVAYENPDPADPFVICSFCSQLVDLTAYLEKKKKTA